jgi:putative ABC transport system permease protein
VADHVITAGRAGLPLEAIARIATETGVQMAIGFVPTKIYPVFAGGDLEPYNAYGVTAGPLERVLDLGYEPEPTTELGPTEVALSTELATEFGARRGDTITLRLGDGALVERTVAGVFSRALGFGDAILPAASIEDHVTEPLIATVMIRTDPMRPVPQSIWAAFEADHPGARVGGPELVIDADEARANIQASFNYVLLGMVVAFSLIALINTLVLSVSDRVREFAQLRLVGVTRRQIKQMMRWEALIVTTIGCILGGAVAFMTLVPFSKAVTGSVIPYAPWTQCVAIALAALTAAVIGNAIPTHLALRSRPVDAIGVRD